MMRVGLIYGIYFEDRQGRRVKLLQKVFGCVIFYFQIFLSRQTDSDVSLIFDVLRVRRKRARRIGNLHKIFIYRIFSTAVRGVARKNFRGPNLEGAKLIFQGGNKSRRRRARKIFYFFAE